MVSRMTPHTDTPRSDTPCPALLRDRSSTERTGWSWFPLLALVFALPSCSGKAGGRGGFLRPPTPVEVANVEPSVVRDQFQALGSVDSDELIDIVAEISAKVIELPFAEGQAVGAGQLLARLDDSEIKAQAMRAGAERDRARSDHERAKQLFDRNAVSAKELDDATIDLRVAEADYEVAAARLAKTLIRAPFAGLVGRRRVSQGAYLSVGQQITELARVDRMRVTFAAPERFMGDLRVGVPVAIQTPAYPGETFSGRLSVVDPIVDPQTRTVQLVASVPNRERRLRPGMSADVRVTLAQRSSALMVPDEAVFAEGNQEFVYVVQADSTVTRAAVRLGTRDSAMVEVVSGLDAGARVVRAGHQKLFDGARVLPISSGEPGGPGAGGPAAGADGEKEPSS
jgi:membrane fusion protein (multidrug efflux system)